MIRIIYIVHFEIQMVGREGLTSVVELVCPCGSMALASGWFASDGMLPEAKSHVAADITL